MSGSTNGLSLIPSNIAEAMDKFPVVGARDDGEHAVDCAMAPFAGCTRKVIPDRFVLVLKDGTATGTCPDWQGHTQAVRRAGTGSEAQRVFTWIVGTFQAANPDRQRGATDPNKVVDLRGAEPKIVDLAEYKPTFNRAGKVTGWSKRS